MRKPDADQTGFAVMTVHPCGGIVEGTAMLEWGREQDDGILLDDGAGRFGMCVDVARQATLLELVPESSGLIRIVVAWQQVPLYGGMSLHSLDDLVARAGRRSCVIVNITRDQYVAHGVLLGEFADARDGLQPCELEAAHFRAINEAEDFAYLSVGGMNKSECHSKLTLLVVIHEILAHFIYNTPQKIRIAVCHVPWIGQNGHRILGTFHAAAGLHRSIDTLNQASDTGSELLVG